jgi:hypothetical protein
MDFVHDQLATGRKLRVLTFVDTFSRFSPALTPRFLPLANFLDGAATSGSNRISVRRSQPDHTSGAAPNLTTVNRVWSHFAHRSDVPSFSRGGDARAAL